MDRSEGERHDRTARSIRHDQPSHYRKDACGYRHGVDEGFVMNHVFVPSPVRLSEVHGLVTAAARCWRTARDQRARVQRRLYALLIDHDCGMLAPVFNGLLTL